MVKLVVALAFLLLTAAPARADDNVPLFQWGIDGNGDPHVVAVGAPGDAVTLSRCDADGSTCVPVADTDASSSVANVTPGETPAGTVYEATLARSGQADVTKRSPAWGGRFAVTTAPAVTGTVAVGGTVQAVPGTTVGGWPSQAKAYDLVEACSQPAGGQCWWLAYGSVGPIDAGFAGWYLSVNESWGSGNLTFGQGMPSSVALPSGPFPWFAGYPNAFGRRSDWVGPIYAPPAPPAPTASIRARALRSKGRLSVGRVTCAQRCTVSLTATGAGRTVRRTLHVSGLHKLTIPVRHGRLNVRVVVDGTPLAAGISRAR